MNKKKFAIYYALVFIVYNVVLFVIAGFKNNTAAFWSAYYFSISAFVLAAAITVFTFVKHFMLRDRIFKLPLIIWTGGYLGIQFLFSCVIMIIYNCSFKIPTVFGVIWLSLFIALIVSCSCEKVTPGSHEDSWYYAFDEAAPMHRMYMEINKIIGKVSANDRPALRKVALKFRYSDPASNDAVIEAEARIKIKLNELRYAVLSNDGKVKNICVELEELLDERNIKCKYRNPVNTEVSATTEKN